VILDFGLERDGLKGTGRALWENETNCTISHAVLYVSGFLTQFIPCLIRGGNDRILDFSVKIALRLKRKYAMESSETLLKKALRLKPQDRFLLVDGLIRSLDEPDGEIDVVWIEEAEKRLRAHRDGHRRPNYWIERIPDVP
jgi:hypothetical protein